MRYLLLHYFIQELCIVLLEAHGSNGIALGQALPGRPKDTTAQSSRCGDAAGLSGSTSSCLLQLSEDHSTRGNALVIIMGSAVILPVSSLCPSQKAQVHLFSPFPVPSACSLTQPNTRCPFGLVWHYLLNFGGRVRARVCLQAPPEVKLLQELHSCKRHTTTMPPMGRAVSCCLLPGSL